MKTQKIILVAVVAFLGIATSFDTLAQKAKVWSTGPEAGVSISSYGMDASDNDSKPGVVVGGFITYSIINTFAVTTKLLYYQKGASFPSSNTKQTLHYFEVPVIGRFFLNKEGDFRPNLFVGPSFGFLGGASNKVGSNETTKIVINAYTVDKKQQNLALKRAQTLHQYFMALGLLSNNIKLNITIDSSNLAVTNNLSPELRNQRFEVIINH